MQLCPHCNQFHPAEARVCPNTGRLIIQPQRWGLPIFLVIGILGLGLIGSGVWLLIDTPLSFASRSTPVRSAINMVSSSTPTITHSPTRRPTSTLTPTSLPSETEPPSPTPIPATATPQLPATPRGHIVYTCFDGADDEICLLDVAAVLQQGARFVQITNNAVGDFYPSLSPDGRSILFARQIRGSNYEIFRMALDGSAVTQLTFNGAQNYGPAAAPDGAHILLASNQGGNGFQIWIMDADGANSRALTDAGSNADPSWSRDGLQIAYASTRSGQQQLWVMNADGTNPRQMTELPDVGGRNDWSADGQTLTFYAGKRAEANRRVYFVDLDGAKVRQLPAEGDSLGPSFSPYGEWVTFTAPWDGDNEIYIARMDGTGLANLTQNPGADYQPRWGP